ncbi:MAG: cupin domain-containing protein [Acidiferrobacterales bacterium]
MIKKTAYDAVQPYVTLDGSLIRELMHPRVHGNHAQSLAEATVAVGAITRRHRHERTEELYHFTDGEGLMTLGDNVFAVKRGDTVCIHPGTPHCVRNTGHAPLKILCCSTPPYADSDTELLD